MRCLPVYIPVLFLSFLVLSPAGKSQAPALRFEHISSGQGLSNSTIETIFQDSRGFIWFGTRDGLNRFDGYQMVVYRYSARDSTSISDNFIRCIYEDRDQTLWIGTSNGLNRYDRQKNRFLRYKHLPSNSQSLSNNSVTSIYQEGRHNIWIGTYGGGLDLLQPTTGQFVHFRHGAPGSLSDDRVNCLYEDPGGQFWVGTENGLNLFDRSTRRFSTQALRNTPEKKSAEVIRVISSDGPQRLWIGTEDDGLFFLDPVRKNVRHFLHAEKDPASLGSNLVRTILPDSDHHLWIGTINGGLNLFDPATAAFSHYQNEPDNPAGLSQRTISALFEDNQHNLWVGTHRGGINLYTPSWQKFGLHRQIPGSNSISYNDVKCFFEDSQGIIWIGTDGGGLNRFDPTGGGFRHYRYNPFDVHSLSSNEVLNVMEDSEGNLWVSTWGGGLNLLDRNTGTCTRFTQDPRNPYSISSNYVQQVFEDDRKNLWVATYYGGLNLLDRKTKRFTRAESDEKHLTHFMGSNVISVCQDGHGNLWFGTDDGGLNCYERSTSRFEHYFTDEEKMPDLRVLFVDSRQRLWAGQAGLFLFNDSLKRFSPYTSKGGLATEFIKGICEDREGNFWISTSNGLTRFNPNTFTLKKYNTADGLQGLEFEANAYMQTRKGRLFFGGVNGFNTFYPEDIKLNRFIPPVYVTDFQILNKKVTTSDKGSPLRYDISATKEIALSYRQSTFSLGFAALNYVTAENNQYAYRMRGLDSNWNYVGNEHRAFYTNLAPGLYHFDVKAANNDGVWNEKGVTIRILVTPPFWATWWFRTLAVMAIASAVFILLYFKRRVEIQQIEEKKLEEMHRMQLQFFTNISHEFRTPLSLILGPLEKLQKEVSPSLQHHIRTVHRNARRLTGLINELMDFRKVEEGALKLKVMPGNLSLFLHEIAAEFKDVAEEKQLRFSVQVAAGVASAWFDRQVLEKIMINLISNSCKYTAPGGAVTVEAFTAPQQGKPAFENELVIRNTYQARQYVYIRIADNGIGISGESIQHLFERYYKITESHLGSGIGLAFVKSLTILHKGNIHVSSERYKGTEIIIGLPVLKEDYTPEERWIRNRSETPLSIESMDHPHVQPIVTHVDDLPVTAKAGHPRRSKKILVVDDNDELRNFLKDSLQPHYHVFEAADGQAGLIEAREVQPDLIISDVMMPVMNGMEFCRQIKENLETSHIPFMMLTARQALASNIEGIESGADFYFAKPLSMELLLLTLHNIFEQREKLKERYLMDVHIEARELVYTAKDKELIDRLLRIIEENLSDPDLDVESICQRIGMSRTALYQKIKGISGQSVTEFVRSVRLRKAVQIMTEEDVLLTEVMYRVGIQTQSYFTKAFKKEFGKTPTQFLQELKK